MNKRKTNLTDKSDYSLINIISLANKYISFLINNNLYAIKLDLITEIVKETNITKIPCTPSFIKGLTNLKGNFSTVISLKEFLNLSEEDKTNNKPSIAISNEETTISILIDSLGEIVDMPEDLAISQNNANITTEVIINNKIYTIINVDKLLHSKELYIFE